MVDLVDTDYLSPFFIERPKVSAKKSGAKYFAELGFSLAKQSSGSGNIEAVNAKKNRQHFVMPGGF